MTDTTEPARMPVLDLPDTPAGQQLAWMLTHSVSRGRDLTVADVAEHMAFPPPWTPADGLKRFQEGDDRVALAAKVKSDSPHAIEVVLDYGDDKPWNAALSVEPQPPHRIVRNFWSRAIPEDVTI